MPNELALLIEHSDAAGRAVVQEAAVTAGLMWKCRARSCPTTYNRIGEPLCRGCGRDRKGRFLPDLQPGLYAVPDELWEQLRTEVVQHFAGEQGTPTPDAVTFLWECESRTEPWSFTEVVLHYGGRQEKYQTAFAGTEIAELLKEIALAVEPNYLDNLRIGLPR
ncbi:hypothetical protein ACGRHY_28920 [Streptomyces sp. HK10]|uniref:hypothetical protein n=1 Tax=Streptomyces sp. HK10 TaxID=3373255 RepID=UPI00374A322C